MVNNEEIDNVFNTFINNCSSEDLMLIVCNELDEKELINLLQERNTEVKKNVLDNFGVEY